MASETVNAALAILDRTVMGIDGDNRSGQQRLTSAIAQSIDQGCHLMAQAPTGSGKSLAYLAPIVASGVRAVVATATLALQDQLWRNDIPMVAEFSGQTVTSALLKGRSNYLCLARLDGTNTEAALFDERPGPTFSDDLITLKNFAEVSSTGDVGDLEESIAPESWRSLTCGPNECPGASKCAQGVDCFAERARSQAELANIIVVNHALYSAHLATGGRLLPPHDLVVIDEAHAFDAVATNALGAEISPGGLRQLGSRLRRAGATARHADAVISGSGRLEDILSQITGRINPIPVDLAEVLAGTSEAVANASASVKAKESALAAQAVKLSLTRLDALRRMQAPDQGEVLWVEGDKRRSLRLAPVSIGKRLVPLLFSQTPVVLISATLGSGERFSPLAQRLGLNPNVECVPVGERSLARKVGLPDEEEMSSEDEDGFTLVAPEVSEIGYEALSIESPFDLEKQGLLYVARHLPDVREPEWAEAAADELCSLVAAAGGRTLVLCTSWKGVGMFSEVLENRTDHKILTQGEETTVRLVEQFSSDETSCLVATRAFWQGLDIPGPACVLVVIDRLPFSRPDDPLEQARREAAVAAGGDGFREIDLPAAALVLAQGTGRLIRTHKDHGVVAVLDRRLAVANYRSVLLTTMPAFARSVDLLEVEAFLSTAST